MTKSEFIAYLSIAITVIFFTLWAVTNIKNDTLFSYYIVIYPLSIITSTFIPDKIFQK